MNGDRFHDLSGDLFATLKKFEREASRAHQDGSLMTLQSVIKYIRDLARDVIAQVEPDVSGIPQVNFEDGACPHGYHRTVRCIKCDWKSRPARTPSA